MTMDDSHELTLLKTHYPELFELKHLTGMFSAFAERCDPDSLQKITRTKRITVSYAGKKWLSKIKLEDWVSLDHKYEALIVTLSNGIFLYSPNTDFKGVAHERDFKELDLKEEPVASAFEPIINYGARYLAIDKTKMEVTCSYTSTRRSVFLNMCDPSKGKLMYLVFKR